MKSYTIEFNGSGESCEGHFSNDTEAKSWLKTVLEARGYDVSELFECPDWDADGTNDDGELCWRLLYWENETDAENDPGVNAICQLCKAGK